MRDAPFLEIQGLSLAFAKKDGDIRVLEDISLSAARGDLVCVVGPSGCGKTTLLRIIAGFLSPTQGRVLVDGEPVTAPGWERGMVFQQPGLYPWLTVRRNVEFGPKMRGLPRAERREIADRYLAMVKLADFAESPPYELSGGMQQRAAIARVLANDPAMLLMDEPFGALDAFTRDHLQEELLSIWRETAKTVVFVTHSVEEAVYLATHLVVLSDRPGKILDILHPPFSREQPDTDPRKIKSSPEFVNFREQVLARILKR